jgi:Xaa-Pro aminopeptidase
MKIPPISSALFIRNRAKLIELMKPGEAALVGSSSSKIRSGDQYYPYRQHSDFFYLTGVNQPESILLVTTHRAGGDVTEVLFLKKPTSKSLLWNGPGLTPDEAAGLSGIGQVRWLDEIDTVLSEQISAGANVYISGDIPLSRISEQYPDLHLSSLGTMMMKLRRIKEPEELSEIKAACSITRAAFERVLGKMVPGIWEYEVEAEIIAEFIRMGSDGHAYEPIVASGKNALILHYVENRDQCRSGDLVLMDFGAEVNNYASDCSRTIPVNGHFTARQREVYDAVLRVFRKASQMMVPGVLMSDFHHQVGELFQEEHIGLGLYTMKEAKSRPSGDPLWKDYYMHGTSHSLGLDVHDPCDRSIPVEKGMVITCEPAIYLREEGIGIRLENDILITEEGPVDLMADIPIEAEEIEKLIQSE